MKLSEAIKKARRQKIIGWIVSLTSLILLSMSVVLYIYRILKEDTSVFKSISESLVILINFIYQKTQFLSLLWSFAPNIHYPNIFVEDNLKFAAVLCAFILGIIMKDSGTYLTNRINKVRQKAEEKVWEKSLTGETSSVDTLRIEIPIESKDNWYTRPFGIITMAIIGGYIVNFLSKLSGF